MTAATESVSGWLGAFEAAMESGEVERAAAMFADECYWRDLVSFTWNIKTLEGRQEIGDMLRARLEDVILAGAEPELLELHVAVLSTVKRLLRELDLAERIRRQLRLVPPARPRLPRAGIPTPGRRTPAAPDASPDAETQLLPSLPDDQQPAREPDRTDE